jgi:hypothetical protein
VRAILMSPVPLGSFTVRGCLKSKVLSELNPDLHLRVAGSGRESTGDHNHAGPSGAALASGDIESWSYTPRPA